MRMFRNDYSEGAAPEILAALVATNDEQTVGYTEGDPHCERARELIRATCGRDDVDVEFCIGGTSANVIGVTGLLEEWEGAVCTPDAHINVHETGAVAACGRTVLPTDDRDGFLSPEAAERVWRFQTSTGRHMTRPGCVYISDTTEIGGVWDLARFDAICDWADSRGLPVFLDGARLGSALTSPAAGGLTLEHIARRCGAFYLGGTKNGMLMGEAMVIADPKLRRAFPYLQKERGGLLAKGRLLGVQFEAAFSPAADGGEALYWHLARGANERALQLRAGMVELGFEPYGDSASNQQFFVMSAAQRDAFEAACGCETFYELPDGRVVARFVCSWATQAADVDELLALASTLA
ncbi:threonine aldolase family protein [Olsenella profusa]|uniref:Aromatic amino acid beta-eliminating lyase/threonine aldolase domain-containing protein n=1 Tax=Olsenella profusa TaxID=138595 RepID=A0ABS2F2H5_9ACTN|nr:beta-eliminating lyase-related protein [Olsenella profusa]MBM6774992.1 hypothetical protein [Olsenella profusa]